MAEARRPRPVRTPPADALYPPEGSGGKPLGDPYVMEPITGGVAIVGFDLGQSAAETIASRLNHAGG